MQGTWHFMSAVLLFFPGHFEHAVWHDLESFIHSLHWMCLRFHKTNKIRAHDLYRCIEIYSCAHRGQDGISYGGGDKLEVMLSGRIPFVLQGGSVDQPKGLHSLLVALSHIYGEHYAWLEAQSMLPTLDDTANKPSEDNVVQDASEDQEGRVAEMMIPPAVSEFVQDTAAAPVPSPPSNLPEAVLNYQHVKRAFAQALFPSCEWTDDPKSVIDHFAQFDQSTSRRRTSAKRASDGSSDRKEKRHRNIFIDNEAGTETLRGSQLGSIGEHCQPTAPQ